MADSVDVEYTLPCTKSSPARGYIREVTVCKGAAEVSALSRIRLPENVNVPFVCHR